MTTDQATLFILVLAVLSYGAWVWWVRDGGKE